jgi:hypothetical protein
MKIIFLDIDGVCNTPSFLRKVLANKTIVSEVIPEECLDYNNIVHLNTLCEKSGASIVISSSWRIFFSLPAIREALAAKGFLYSENIVGKTPKLDGKERGFEIKDWLKNNPVDGFVIIDDNDDMVSLFSHLVKTDYAFGLQEKNVAAALYILNKED